MYNVSQIFLAPVELLWVYRPSDMSGRVGPFSLSSRMGSGPHLIYGSLTHPSHIPNGISIASAVFAQLTAESPYTSQRATTFPRWKLPIRMGDLDLHLIRGSLGPTESNLWQRHSRFSRFCRTHVDDRQTDRRTTLFHLWEYTSHQAIDVRPNNAYSKLKSLHSGRNDHL